MMKTKFLYIAIGLLLGSTAVAQSWSWNWNYCNTSCEDPTGQVDTELRDGSKEKPYTISSAQELANFCAYVNTKTAGDAYYGKYVVLCSDIVLNENLLNANGNLNSGAKEWIPIGEYGILWNDSFEGHFDGQGHSISGVCITSSNRDYTGLFGDLKYGSISNLHVKDSYIGGASDYAGGIVAHTHGTTKVTNCTFQGVVKNGTDANGGIVGYAEDAISVTGCKVTGRIEQSAATYTGGICGYANGTIERCYNYASISLQGDKCKFAGGIVGTQVSNHTIFCGNMGNIDATNVTGELFVGGIAGQTGNQIKQCFNHGHISATSDKVKRAGIVGDFQNVARYDYIFDNFSTGNTSNGYGIAAQVRSQGDMDDANALWLSGTAVQGFPAGDNDTERSSEIFTDYKAAGNAFSIMEEATGELWGYAPAYKGYPMPVALGGQHPYFYLQGEDGTEEKPYQVATTEDFYEIHRLLLKGESFEGRYIRQTADLDFSLTANFTPMGLNYNIMELGGEKYDMSEMKAFAGNYDGQNHTIKGATISQATKFGSAIFLENQGSISNLIVDGFTNADNSRDAVAAAALVHTNSGTISNIIVKNSHITAQRATAGGVVAINYGTIEQASVLATTVEGLYVGGIAGTVHTGAIRHASSMAVLDTRNCQKAQDQTPSLGGIAGIGNKIEIQYSTAHCDLSYWRYNEADKPYIGGMIGLSQTADAVMNIQSCIAQWGEDYPWEMNFGFLVGGAYNANTVQYSVSDMILHAEIIYFPQHVMWGGMPETTEVDRTLKRMTYLYNTQAYDKLVRNEGVDWEAEYFNSENIVDGYYKPLPKLSPTTYAVQTLSATPQSTYLDMTATIPTDNTLFQTLSEKVVDEFYELPNIVKAGQVRHLQLTDSKDYDCNTTLTANNIHFTREGAQGWTTLCLPFDLDPSLLPAGAWAECVTSISAQYVTTELATETIPAGTAFLLYSEDNTLALALTDGSYAVTQSVSDGPLKGCFVQQTLTEGDYYYDATSDSFVRVTEETLLNAFQAYLPKNKVAGQSDALRVLHQQDVPGDNTATGISNGLISPSTNSIKVVENGQVVIIRNGKKYSITGARLQD